MFDQSPDIEFCDITFSRPSTDVPERLPQSEDVSPWAESWDTWLCPSPTHPLAESETVLSFYFEQSTAPLHANSLHDFMWEDFDLYPSTAETEEVSNIGEEWDLFQSTDKHLDHSLGSDLDSTFVENKTAVDLDPYYEWPSISSEASLSPPLSTIGSSPASSTKPNEPAHPCEALTAHSPAYSWSSQQSSPASPSVELGRQATDAARSSKAVVLVNTNSPQRRKSTPFPCNLCRRISKTSVEARHVHLLSLAHHTEHS